MPQEHRRLRLRAQSADDLEVMSALLQDALLPMAEASWDAQRRRLVLVAQRFRREAPPLERRREFGERVSTALRFDNVLRVLSVGLDRSDPRSVAYLLRLVFEPTDGCAGMVRALCSNHAEIRIEVECLDAYLSDVSRPWVAVGRPRHEDEGD